jgi:hypothetical protein
VAVWDEMTSLSYSLAIKDGEFANDTFRATTANNLLEYVLKCHIKNGCQNFASGPKNK